MREWLARPRLSNDEAQGVLDDDNPLKGGYRRANMLVTLLDNHDLQRRIMSHARTKHTGDGGGLDWAIRVTKLCLGALFTMRGIPQLYYGTEVGLEGWKAEDDRDLRRDFPWQVIGADQHPLPAFHKERSIYEWTRDLIRLRKGSDALKYGATVTLWSDDLVYAFLRVATDDVALVVINNGYEAMPQPLRIYLNPGIVAPSVADKIRAGLRHWQSGTTMAVDGDYALVSVEGKSMDIYCWELP